MTRPCDCISIHDTRTLLNEQGIIHNNYSIELIPNSVILSAESATIKIPMSKFKLFAEWYLEDQEKK